MQVIAIGGSASVGKTTVAAELARRLEIRTLVQVDDLRTGLGALGGSDFVETTPTVWHQPADRLVHSLIQSTQRLHASIAATIDGLVRVGEPAIIEGEGIEPQLMRWPSDAVWPIYIVEAQSTRLRATFDRRPSAGRFRSLSALEQDAVVEMNRRYGAWLRSEAEAHHQTCLDSQPWESLADRVTCTLVG